MIKRCIIFDDNDQSEEIEKLIRDGRNKGIEIECYQFNVGSTQYTEFLTDGEIDINKVVKRFKETFNRVTFHLAVFDWNLEDDNIDGIELIRLLSHNNILRKTPKIVISAKLRIILNDIVKTKESKRIERLTSLVNTDIRGYKERENYENDIINFFLKEEETLDLILEEELRKFPELKFDNRFVNKNFNGKTFLELADFIENDDTIRNDFKKEIIQQVIAYLTEKI